MSKTTTNSAVYIDSLAFLKANGMIPNDDIIELLGPDGIVDQAKTLSEKFHAQDLGVKKVEAKDTFNSAGISLTKTTKHFKKVLMNKVRAEIGTAPSKGFTLTSLPLNDGSTISAKFNAVLKNPDNAERKEQISLEVDLVEAFTKALEAVGIAKVSEAMRLEAGTKDAKTVTLIKSSVDEYNVSVGLAISRSATKDAKLVEL